MDLEAVPAPASHPVLISCASGTQAGSSARRVHRAITLPLYAQSGIACKPTMWVTTAIRFHHFTASKPRLVYHQLHNFVILKIVRQTASSILLQQDAQRHMPSCTLDYTFGHRTARNVRALPTGLNET
jgi:hypothetical protein